MTKRKSIVSAFGDFRSEESASEKLTEKKSDEVKAKPKRVAAGIVGTTQRTLSQIREERDRLLEQAVDGGQIIKLDPAAIEKSPFRDRLPDDNKVDFETLKRSLSDEGQKVPITVRRHPDDEHRFQIVYGHRRWRALKEIDREVEAIVSDYSDRDLVIAQGIENANRQDLSWIERALFAHEMQEAGIKPRDIKAALGIDDAELSKLRSVLKSVPQQVIEAVGRAPSIGRPRWLEFSSLVKTKADITKLVKTLSSDKVMDLPSDDRFMAALAVVAQKATKLPENPSEQLNMELGEVGSMIVSAKAIKINLAKQHSEGFRRFLEAEMKGLVERYKSSLEEK